MDQSAADKAVSDLESALSTHERDNAEFMESAERIVATLYGEADEIQKQLESVMLKIESIDARREACIEQRAKLTADIYAAKVVAASISGGGMVEVKLERDYWSPTGERIKAGRRTSMLVDEATRAVVKGIATLA